MVSFNRRELLVAFGLFVVLCVLLFATFTFFPKLNPLKNASVVLANNVVDSNVEPITVSDENKLPAKDVNSVEGILEKGYSVAGVNVNSLIKDKNRVSVPFNPVMDAMYYCKDADVNFSLSKLIGKTAIPAIEIQNQGVLQADSNGIISLENEHAPYFLIFQGSNLLESYKNDVNFSPQTAASVAVVLKNKGVTTVVLSNNELQFSAELKKQGIVCIINNGTINSIKK